MGDGSLFKRACFPSSVEAGRGDEMSQSNILSLLKEIKDNQLKFQREQQSLRSLSLLASKQWEKPPRIIQKNQETYNIYGTNAPPMIVGRLQKAREKQAENQVRVLGALELAKPRPAFLNQPDASGKNAVSSARNAAGFNNLVPNQLQFQRIGSVPDGESQQARMFANAPQEEVSKGLGAQIQAAGGNALNLMRG